jgi:hypothetical protein
MHVLLGLMNMWSAVLIPVRLAFFVSLNVMRSTEKSVKCPIKSVKYHGLSFMEKYVTLHFVPNPYVHIIRTFPGVLWTVYEFKYSCQHTVNLWA